MMPNIGDLAGHLIGLLGDLIGSSTARLGAAGIGTIRARVTSDLDEAVAFAEQSPFPDPKDLLVDMFAD